MKREFLIALFVCFCLGMTGCDASKEVANTNQVQTEVEAEHKENEDVAVSDMDETTDETSEDDVTKDTTTVDDVLDLTESNVIVRDSLELDKKHTKVQIITDEDYTFEDDFILEYTDAIPEYKEVINISNYYVKEYDLGDDKFVYIIREDDEDRVIDTCIYFTMSDFEPFDEDTLCFYECVPNEDNYEYTTVDQGDAKIVEYVDTLEYTTDCGTQYFDSDGHLIIWEYYLTSGSRKMLYIWDDDNVSMIIDTGGQAWSSDDEGALIGIYTLIYKFNEPVPFEEIVFE